MRFCKQGHPLEGLNITYNDGPDGIVRQCRICRNIQRNARLKLKRRIKNENLYKVSVASNTE